MKEKPKEDFPLPLPRLIPAVLLSLCLALVMPGPVAAQYGITRLTTDNFAEVVNASPRPVLVVFMAKWCPYCRQQQPELERLQRDKAGEVDVYRIDIDEDPGIAQAYGAEVLPTMVMLYQGNVIDGVEGALFGAELRDWIASVEEAVKKKPEL
jgi:thioredoxin-like negative regulator of GroEL